MSHIQFTMDENPRTYSSPTTHAGKQIRYRSRTITLLVLTLAVVLTGTNAYVTRIEQCEPIEIPRCQAMPYNMTQMPNLVHHNTQQNARLVFQRFEELLDSRCSDVLLFLLCAIYVPICPVSLLQREAIPPCRDVCERARQGCEPVMNRYNVSWSDAFFDCSRLPWYERGVCVIPEAIVQKSDRASGHQRRGQQQQQHLHHHHQSQQRQHVRKPVADGGMVVAPAQRAGRFPVCRCKRKRPSWKWFRKYDYDYAVRATMKKRKRNKRGELLYRVKVTQVLFSGKVKVEPTKMATLLVLSSQCSCLKLRRGREYLILGHENRETNRLVVSQLSITARWRDVFSRRIAKWHKRLDKRKRQNRRNRTDLPSLTTRNRQVGQSGDSESGTQSGPDLGSPTTSNGESYVERSKEDRSAEETSSPNSDDGKKNGRRRGGRGRGRGGGGEASHGYGSFNLDDLQNGYRHGGRFYSKELAQLHRYKLAALRELLE